MLKKILVGLAAVAVLGFASFQVFLYSIHYYDDAPVYQTGNGALDGYDPVAYFTSGEPTRGRAEISHEWNGATWHFASAEHRLAFQADPARYAPQFGGYCATAVAGGYVARTRPEAWDIVNGKLYLNYDIDVREQWRADRETKIRAAEAHWVNRSNALR
jgi:YHS domain-containing protein